VIVSVTFITLGCVFCVVEGPTTVVDVGGIDVMDVIVDCSEVVVSRDVLEVSVIVVVKDVMIEVEVVPMTVVETDPLLATLRISSRQSYYLNAILPVAILTW
jgi:hypothetical protein